MSGEQGWRTEINAEDYFGHQQKKVNVADRRPVIRKAADLVGPGIDAHAVEITDFRDPLATYNGFFFAAAGAVGAPTGDEDFVGLVVNDANAGGVQRFTGLTSGIDYKCVFIRNPSDPDVIYWGAWTTTQRELAPGVMMPFGGAVAPDGWIICNGASYATALYPDLFAAIGYTWGGAGANFNVPDARDRTFYGVGSAWALGANDGLSSGSRGKDLIHAHEFTPGAAGGHNHTALVGQSGAHTHTIPAGGDHNHGGSTGTPSGTANRASGADSVAGSNHTHSITTGGNHDHGGSTGAVSNTHDHVVGISTVSDHTHTGVVSDTLSSGDVRLRGLGANWIIRSE